MKQTHTDTPSYVQVLLSAAAIVAPALVAHDEHGQAPRVLAVIERPALEKVSISSVRYINVQIADASTPQDPMGL